MSVSPLSITGEVTSRRPSIDAIYNPSMGDWIGDIGSALAPGLVFVISFVFFSDYMCATNDPTCTQGIKTAKLKKFLASLVPVAFLIFWYGYKLFTGRKHKVGDLRLIMLGNIISLLLILIVGLAYTYKPQIVFGP